jgi:hypothetical protein
MEVEEFVLDLCGDGRLGRPPGEPGEEHTALAPSS